MRVWYKAVTNRPPPPTHIAITKMTVDKVAMYMHVPPPREVYTVGDRAVSDKRISPPGGRDPVGILAPPLPHNERAVVNAGGSPPGVACISAVVSGPGDRKLVAVCGPGTYRFQGRHIADGHYPT